MNQSLFDLTLTELTEWVVKQGQPAYRAKQIFHALYQRAADSFQGISDLPKDLRDQLRREFTLSTLSTAQAQHSADGTTKWLFKLSDGQLLETVLIPAKARKTVCASTQVGCAYACAFCASGQAGLRRNLTPGEIVEQVLLVERSLMGSDPKRSFRGQTPLGFRVTNIVFMGMGEPLANYENLLKAIRILNAPEGFHLGARKITISTVGLVPMIERLTTEGLQIELSISLHAPNDTVRGTLMPVNRKYPIGELMKAAKAYVAATKRLITFEYILINDINDSLKEAKELVELLKGFKAKVNLIPCHPTPNTPWQRPAMARMRAFEQYLRQKGVVCTLRRSRGLDIEGACGQLRLRLEEAAPGASAHRLRYNESNGRKSPHP